MNTSFFSSAVYGFLNVCVTTSKGPNRYCLASLPGVHLFVYIPVILLLIIMCLMYKIVCYLYMLSNY